MAITLTGMKGIEGIKRKKAVGQYLGSVALNFSGAFAESLRYRLPIPCIPFIPVNSAPGTGFSRGCNAQSNRTWASFSG